MAFDTYETSNNNGRPIALYRFVWGNTIWQYTSADSMQQYPGPAEDGGTGNDFLPISIRDDGMTQGGSSENDFTVHAQSDVPIVALFAESPPTAPVWMTVRRKHADDPDNEAPVYWVGRVTNVMRLDNPAEADIRGVSISKLLQSGGLRLTWGKNCPHCIYDSGCKVPTVEHQYPATIATAGGAVLTTVADMVAEEGTFTGGFVEWDRDGLGTMERRGIEEQSDTKTFRILGRTAGLAPGDSITLYPGCDQTVSTCHNGFDNIPNNGGYWFMPEKTPFDGTQVFD